MENTLLEYGEDETAAHDAISDDLIGRRVAMICCEVEAGRSPEDAVAAAMSAFPVGS
ncbi:MULTISPECIES: hypothetical protein [Arthrobacter]|uniref:Uncharacterized protein n=2 Tax=Arthrobacter TaxID=1663 RepID=A0ABU9KHG1_9MICC|nr:hypothetical protein [Arthrobacter sp. YJM1]